MAGADRITPQQSFKKKMKRRMVFTSGHRPSQATIPYLKYTTKSENATARGMRDIVWGWRGVRVRGRAGFEGRVSEIKN